MSDADPKQANLPRPVDPTDRYVVAVEVEMVIPADDPSEPCYEAETVQRLREVEEHALAVMSIG